MPLLNMNFVFRSWRLTDALPKGSKQVAGVFGDDLLADEEDWRVQVQRGIWRRRIVLALSLELVDGTSQC